MKLFKLAFEKADKIMVTSLKIKKGSLVTLSGFVEEHGEKVNGRYHIINMTRDFNQTPPVTTLQIKIGKKGSLHIAYATN